MKITSLMEAKFVLEIVLSSSFQVDAVTDVTSDYRTLDLASTPSSRSGDWPISSCMAML
jgi:hypothetical protein